jgi:predicted AAA+ superfamily ATPase
MLEQIVRHLGAAADECHFWGTHQGAELDLLVVRGRTRRAFEIKRTTTPAITKSMRIAMADLGLDALDVIHAGPNTYRLAPEIRAIAATRILEDIEKL